MTARFTYTKTFALYHPWASTTPWDCLIRDTGCVHPTHDHSPMVNDPCAEPQCDELLLDGEECYAVIEIGGSHAKDWVCWRHVRPDEGPIRVQRSGDWCRMHAVGRA